MLHRLNGACLLRRSDARQILEILTVHKEQWLENAVANSLQESLDGWVAVPYVAEEKQLKGNTDWGISLRRWQSILELSPEKIFWVRKPL
jgi:hypothetical protein